MPTKYDEFRNKLNSAIDELKTIHKDTPHRRDLVRFIRNAQKQLAIYERYQRGDTQLTG